ncbi:ATP-binding protein [Actinomadura sp. HBU206391]|uniref:ATP-binding protein n=1 Tax=Actinomadura sp. HBU206391 TaxID=2731692 RepID=UPI001650B007|nr:ATP-binding protein [Actinomadura sp. HBU206391]MBC6456602.1 ATP-binding protein [Actinomadura sp. HBU206391]
MQIPFTESAPRNGKDFNLTNGGCSAWILPTGEICAAAGRSLLGRELLAIDLSRDAVHDITLATSELVTNGLRHGIGRDQRRDDAAIPAPAHLELWAYRRATLESQLVVKVFDPLPGWRRPGPEQAGTYAECGRGTQIVEALSERWGWHLTRSRLAAQLIPGKVAWFCVPIDVPCEQVPRLPVCQAAQALLAELASRGITRLQCHHGNGHSLVALPGLTVWAEEPGIFRWHDPTGEPGEYVRTPIADLVHVVEEAVRIHEYAAAVEAARAATEQGQDVPGQGGR